MTDRAAPAAPDRPVTKFVYLLNALENAASLENPADADYRGKRKAVLDYVQALESLEAGCGCCGAYANNNARCAGCPRRYMIKVPKC